MNLKVLTSGGGCSCGNGLGFVPVQSPIDPIDQIIVRSRHGIQKGNIIYPYSENGKKVYELDDFTLVNPQVTFGNDAPAVVEVGDTIETVTFSGEISEGSFPIATRQIDPDPGGLDLTEPFSFEKEDVTRSTPGIAQQHTITVIDNEGNETIKSSGVVFKNPFWQGFSALATLDEEDIVALANKHLIDNILSQYGGLKTYIVPGPDPKYVYWIAPVGTPIIGSATLSGFALPLTSLSNVIVTNAFGIDITCWVKRTVNKIDPGTYQIFVA